MRGRQGRVRRRRPCRNGPRARRRARTDSPTCAPTSKTVLPPADPLLGEPQDARLSRRPCLSTSTRGRTRPRISARGPGTRGSKVLDAELAEGEPGPRRPPRPGRRGENAMNSLRVGYVSTKGDGQSHAPSAVRQMASAAPGRLAIRRSGRRRPSLMVASRSIAGRTDWLAGCCNLADADRGSRSSRVRVAGELSRIPQSIGQVAHDSLGSQTPFPHDALNCSH